MLSLPAAPSLGSAIRASGTAGRSPRASAESIDPFVPWPEIPNASSAISAAATVTAIPGSTTRRIASKSSTGRARSARLAAVMLYALRHRIASICARPRPMTIPTATAAVE